MLKKIEIQINAICENCLYLDKFFSASVSLPACSLTKHPVHFNDYCEYWILFEFIVHENSSKFLFFTGVTNAKEN